MEKGKRPKVRREDIGGKIEKKRALQIDREPFSAPRNPVHLTGMRVGAGGSLEVVGGNSDLLDPVLLKVFKVLDLDPGKIEAATLEKVKEVAAKNGVYETYKSNTSEREKKKDLKRMSRYQSKYPSAPPLPTSQSNSGPAGQTRIVKRVKKALPSFPPPPAPKKKSESGASEADASPASPPPPPQAMSRGENLLGVIQKGVCT